MLPDWWINVTVWKLTDKIKDSVLKWTVFFFLLKYSWFIMFQFLQWPFETLLLSFEIESKNNTQSYSKKSSNIPPFLNTYLWVIFLIYFNQNSIATDMLICYFIKSDLKYFIFYLNFYFLLSLAAPHAMWYQIPQLGIEPMSPALDAWGLNPWTTRKVQRDFKNILFLKFYCFVFWKM